RLAAAAPASTAALTAATSPTTKAVTRPLPTLSQPANSTFAAFTIASLASTRATKPFVSIIPSASSVALAIDRSPNVYESKHSRFRLPQLHIRRMSQVERIRFIGVDMHLQFPVGMRAHKQAAQQARTRPIDDQIHPVVLLDAVIRGVTRPH